MTWHPNEHARTDGPSVSANAAAQYAPKAGSDMWALHIHVQAHPGLTCGELYVAYGNIFDPAKQYAAAKNITRRVADLERAGLVHHGDARRCQVTGRSARPVYPGRAEPDFDLTMTGEPI